MILRLLAALSFAGLLGLATTTVSLQTASLRARARIEHLVLAVKARRFEALHRERALHLATTQAALRERLRALLETGGPE